MPFTDNIDWAEFCIALRSEQFMQCTQKELGQEVGVDANAVSKWERAVSEPRWPRRRKLKALAERCGFREESWPRRKRKR